MLNALRAEMFKVSHRRMTYILILSLTGLVALFYVILWLRIREGPDPGPSSYLRWLALRDGMSFRQVVPYGLQLERFFATLICVIFAATMMGNEYDWRTAGVVISRGVKRQHFFAAKAIMAGAFTLFMITAGFIVALGLSAWFSWLFDLPYGVMNVERLTDMVFSIARTTFVVLPFVYMATLFATIWRSAGQAVGFSLGFFFLETIFTGLLDQAKGFLAHIPEGMLNVNIVAVMRENGTLRDSGPGAFIGGDLGIDVWRATAILAFWTMLFVSVAFWRFQTRDLQE